MPIDLDSIALADLRTRRSAKWSLYPDDVIPAWVAESDFPLAQPIHARRGRWGAGMPPPSGTFAHGDRGGP